jgi:hypothetical protein
MLLEGFEREPDRLSYYLLGAVAVHLVLLAFGSLSSCRAHELVEVAAPSDKLVNIDMEPPPPPVEHPPSIAPGGGSIVGKEDPDEQEPTPVVRRPATQKAKAPPPKEVPREEEETAVEAPEKVAAKTEGEDTDAGVEGGSVAQEVPDAAPEPVVAEVAHFDPEAAAMSRHRKDFAGSGPGNGGGPGGFGAGFGGRTLWANDRDIPKMSGESDFGRGRGALRGVVCFIPKDTAHIRDVQSCDPVTSLYTDELNVPERNFLKGFPGIPDRTEWFAIDYTGKFNVSRAGEYSFRLVSDDGAYLYIDEKQIIDRDGEHAPDSTMGLVTLKEGDHKIRVLYWQGHGGRLALQLFVTPPGHVPERLWGPKL